MNPTAATLPLNTSVRLGSPADLTRLTTAMARGDDDAWREFRGTYGAMLFHQLLAQSRGDHAVASDLLQQTYLRVARHVRPCPEPAQFRAWLRKVARSALLDHWRRQRSFADLLFRRSQEPVAPNEDTDGDRLHAHLDQALARLAPAERVLLEAKYFHGHDVRSLAESAGVSPKALESRLQRARQNLKRLLLESMLRDEQT